MSKVVIVILNYNGKNYLEQFLPITKKFSDCPIYVVDNHSTDNSVAYLNEHHPDIIQLNFEENYGYSGGYKKALEIIKAEFFILLNSDIEVTPNWIEPVIELMESDDSIAACQPKILSYHNRDTFEYAGAAGGFIDTLGYPFCRGRIFDVAEKDEGQYDDNIEVFWATGACLFVRASSYRQAGGLDEDYFAHMEEIDLCWRLKSMGFKNFYCGGSKIYHIGGGTLHKTNPRKTYLNFRNSLITLHKNSNGVALLWKIPFRLVLDGLAGLRFVATGSFGNFTAIIKSHLHYWASFVKIETKRKQVQRQVSISKLSQVLPGFIVFEYFLKNARKFGKLRF